MKATRPPAVRNGLIALGLAWGWDLVSGWMLVGLGLEGMLLLAGIRAGLLALLGLLWLFTLRGRVPALGALAALGAAEFVVALYLVLLTLLPSVGQSSFSLVLMVVLWLVFLGRGLAQQAPQLTLSRRSTVVAVATLLRVVIWAADMMALSGHAHSDALPLPEMTPYLVPPVTAASWDMPGDGYLIVSQVPADDPGVVALARHRDAQVVELAGDAPLEADEIARVLVEHKPRYVAFVLSPGHSGTAQIYAVNRGLYAGGEAPSAYGVLPAEGLEAYVGRVVARERALGEQPHGRPGSVVALAESGRNISPFCEVAGTAFVDMLSGEGADARAVDFDNTQSRRLELDAQQHDALAAAELVLLLGHGDGSMSVGLHADALPDELRASLVVNGTCYGGDPGASMASNFYERGALLQVGGTDITGWVLVSGVLPHLYEQGLSAGEGWRRSMIEARRALSSGAVESSLGALGTFYGVNMENQLDETVLIGDPAFVPFPLGEGEATRAAVSELLVSRG